MLIFRGTICFLEGLIRTSEVEVGALMPMGRLEHLLGRDGVARHTSRRSRTAVRREPKVSHICSAW